MNSFADQKKIIEFEKKINNKKVYFYNTDDENIYTDSTKATLDPLESLAQDRPVCLIPANSTEKIPPNEKEGYVTLFDKEKNKWEQVEDCKGKYYYDFNNQSVKEYKKHKDTGEFFITEEEKQEIYAGKSVRLLDGDGKLEFYYTDEFLIQKIITTANSYLVNSDFYFNKDYPENKVPTRMDEYRQYLRTLNSEHNLKDKDVQNLKVLTYEEFINL